MSAQELWDSALPLMNVKEKHPFLVSMVNGTLEERSFQYYVVQDALYLNDFADCLERLSQNPGVSEADNSRLEAFVVGTKGAELDLHNYFFKEWNIPTEGVVQMPNMLLYTSYTKHVIATQSHSQGLSLLLPCYWVYMHVGNNMLRLRAELGDSMKRPAAYDAWIDMYAGGKFEGKVKDYIAMVDAACQSASSEEFNEMKRHFSMSCKLEHMFWDQAMTMTEWPKLGGI